MISTILALDGSQGYLPLWMAFISGIAMFNSVQTYMTTTLTRRVYSQTPTQVTDLGARTFGVWTMTSALIRICAALDIHNPSLYQLALYSYYIALFHFGTEVLVYKTSKWGAISPGIVASTSIIWMLTQQSYYLP